MKAKPITPEEMTAYVEATWDKCQEQAWQEQQVEDGPMDWPTAEVIDKALDSGFIGTEESEKFLQQQKERKVQS